jgi:hypothetical protein
MMVRELRRFNPETLHPLDDKARAIELAKLLKIPAFTGITIERLWAKIGRALWEYVPPPRPPRGRKRRSLENDQLTIDVAKQVATDIKGMTYRKALPLVVEHMQRRGTLSKHTTVDSHVDQLKPRNMRKRGGK